MASKIQLETGHRLVIAARGDCTSRRAIALNPDLFDQSPVLRQSQKSTFAQMLDALNGVQLSEQFLREISDVDSMPQTLASYYIGQSNRDALKVTDADLLMLDSYADMNFSLWQNRRGGARFWIHPKFLKNREEFVQEHIELGRAALDESVANAVEFISRLREQAPGLPVLFLNQQVDYYPKLADRVDAYYSLGALVAARISDVYYGGVVPKEELELADLDSSGPGNTLHFQGATYRRMIDLALESGLSDAISRREALKATSPTPLVAKPSAEAASTELRSSPCKYAELVITEIFEPNLQFHAGSCNEQCSKFLDSLPKGLDNYFYMQHKRGQTEPPRFTPMLIDLEPITDFQEWIYSRPATYRHQYQKSERAEFLFEPYNVKNHVPDIYEINNSKEIRSGGAIRSNLTKSIEEMGGAPTSLSRVPALGCLHHWRQTFGVFIPIDGYRQGDLEIGKKMIAYISVVRYGDFAVFAQIMGHGDYLDKGVVNFVAQKVVEAAISEPWGKASGLRYLMYGGAQNGGEGLYNFKRRSGFTPYIVSLPFQPGYTPESVAAVLE